MKIIVKNVYAFLIKLLATAKQLIRTNSICCLKNEAIFHRASIDSFPPPVCFHLLFKDHPSPSTANPLLKMVCWKRWKDLMIMLVHSCI